MHKTVALLKLLFILIHYKGLNISFGLMFKLLLPLQATRKKPQNKTNENKHL